MDGILSVFWEWTIYGQRPVAGICHQVCCRADQPFAQTTDASSDPERRMLSRVEGCGVQQAAAEEIRKASFDPWNARLRPPCLPFVGVRDGNECHPTDMLSSQNSSIREAHRFYCAHVVVSWLLNWARQTLVASSSCEHWSHDTRGGPASRGNRCVGPRRHSPRLLHLA